ncbi:Dihydroorotate dehydrogenase (quinone), mitochondrial [Sporothrix bragantina]|uniref:Dihydroorotate dehydrogenase (Quinone), mitochondrial n=1 Tax=Sporothrix bragantina TaxID=671064 RepID=A0ABP0B0C7_9PEZI
MAPLLRTARISQPSLALRSRYASTTPTTPPASTTTTTARGAPVENVKPASIPTGAPIETVKPASIATEAAPVETVKPASIPIENGKPAAPIGTVKPASIPVETVKSAVENIKSATETIKPAAEAIKSAAESTKPTVETVKPAVEAIKSAASSAASSATTPTSTPAPLPTPAPAPLTASSSPRSGSGLRTAAYVTAFGATLFALFMYGTDTRASVHRWIVPPLIRTFYPDAEDAHHIGTEALKILYRLGLNPRDRTDDDEKNKGSAPLNVSTFGGEHALSNPMGISAGLDKDADIPDALFDFGAAVVEVGGCTPRPQAGNPRPRVFRVPSIEGLVNRYGLNSIGADAMASRLRTRLRAFARAHGLREEDILSGAAGVPVGSLRPGKLLAVQMAKNKDTDEHNVQAVADDYVYCVRRLAPYADVLVVNVSSPNTPGLRDLQAVEPLTRILAAVVQEAQKTAQKSTSSTAAVESGLQTLRARAPRVMVKVSPDEDEDSQIDGICEAVFASGVDGIIVGNTTKRRTGLVPDKLRLRSGEQQNLAETGGYSGPAMYDRTLALVGRYRQRLDEQSIRGEEAKTLFASGGVTNGEQALKLLNAGASVAMVYTGLVYGGAGTITRIKEEMREKITAAKKPTETKVMQAIEEKAAEAKPIVKAVKDKAAEVKAETKAEVKPAVEAAKEKAAEKKAEVKAEVKAEAKPVVQAVENTVAEVKSEVKPLVEAVKEKAAEAKAEVKTEVQPIVNAVEEKVSEVKA